MTTPITPYRAPVDIANRALQHLGKNRIQSFNDDSKAAVECVYCYDKLRQAELRRNLWRFSIRKTVLRAMDVSMMLFTPATWTAGSYPQGSIVTYQNTVWQQNTLGSNTQEPDGEGSGWEPFFGNLFVDLWNAQATNFGTVPSPSPPLAYYPGELTYVVAAPASWVFDTSYAAGIRVTSSAIIYTSLIDGNLGNPPASSPSDWAVVSLWDTSASYTTGTTVVDTSGLYWVAQQDNSGQQPGSNLDYWVRSDNQTYQAYLSLISANSDEPPTNNWLVIPGTLALTPILYPIGSGPSSQTFTRNVYPLPSVYLREAPQDPKAGSNSFLGASTARRYDDWTFENGFFTSRESEPIVFRFAADVIDVSTMDPMFCEGLAVDLAINLAPTLAPEEDTDRLAVQYHRITTEARIVNGIETGPTEPPEDDYIACRI